MYKIILLDMMMFDHDNELILLVNQHGNPMQLKTLLFNKKKKRISFFPT
jgi:hypothetical protein